MTSSVDNHSGLPVLMPYPTSHLISPQPPNRSDCRQSVRSRLHASQSRWGCKSFPPPPFQPRSPHKTPTRCDSRIMAFLSTIFSIIAICLFPGPRVLAYPFPKQQPPRVSSPSYLQDHQLGAVASESDICTRIGIGLLKDGGNAADAVRQSRPFYPQQSPSTDHVQSLSERFSVSVWSACTTVAWVGEALCSSAAPAAPTSS